MPTWLVAVLGIASFIGMIVCAKKKDKPQAKLVAGIFLVVLVVCAGMYMSNEGVFGEDKATRDQRSSYARFEESEAKALGDYISGKFASDKIVIVAPGGTDFAKQLESNKLPGNLKNYIKAGNVEIKGLNYTNKPEEMGPMMGANAKNFNEFFKENSDATLFVLVENLPFDPAEAAKITIWNNKGKQKLAIVNGDVSMMYPYIKSGIVAAAVTTKSGLKEEDYEKLAPVDLAEAFQARYVLITPENVDSFKGANIFR